MHGPALKVYSFSAGYEIPSDFVKPRVSLPCPPKPTTRSCPQPVESILHPHAIQRFILILNSHLHLGPHMSHSFEVSEL